jgi:hypothetical protein
MKNYEESRIQKSCIKWFRLQYPKHTLFAIPNGGKRGKIEASIMKGEGVLAGVADLFLMCSNKNHFHGLFIEIKTGKGRQSKTQEEFCYNALMNGYLYVVCRDLDEFMKEVNDYLK